MSEAGVQRSLQGARHLRILQRQKLSYLNMVCPRVHRRRGQQRVDGCVLQRLRRALKQLQVAGTDEIAEDSTVPCALVVIFIAHTAAVAADVERGVDVNRQSSGDGKRQRVEEEAAACNRGSNTSVRYSGSNGGEGQLEARGTMSRCFSEPG